MNIPEWCILDIFYKLNIELTCPKLPMVCEDPREWSWQVKNTNIQFVVRAEDKIFRVETYESTILRSFDDTDDPQKVIQAARTFKSKYLHNK